MTALTPDQTAWLQSELGGNVDLVDLQTRYDRLASVRDVAIEVWRSRRAGWMASPLSTNLSGVASVNYTENVKAATARIEALVSLDDDPSDDPVDEQDGGVDTLTVVQTYRTRGR